MSHVAVVKVEINDLNSLEKACENLGLELRRDQKTFKWFGRWVNDYHAQDAAYRQIDPKTFGKCEHAIGVKGNKNAYEIGVLKNKTGRGYTMIYDNWQGGYGLEKAAGRGLTQLASAYTQEVTKKHMLMQGYTYGGAKTKQDGTIEMVFNKY